MKRITKKLLCYLVLLSIFGLSSCEKQEIDTQNKAQVTSKYITLNELKGTPLIFDVYKKIEVKTEIAKKAKYSGRSTYLAEFGFSIDTDKILQIQKEGYTSYTIPIIRENETEKTENLIISENSATDIQAFVSKYTLTNEDKNNLIQNKSVNLDAITEIVPLPGFTAPLLCWCRVATSYTPEGQMDYSYWEPCECPPSTGGGGTSGGGGTGGGTPSGGSSGGNTTGSGSTSGSSGNSSGSGTSGTSSSGNNYGNIIILSGGYGTSGSNGWGNNGNGGYGHGGNSGGYSSNNPNATLITAPVFNYLSTEDIRKNFVRNFITTPVQLSWWNNALHASAVTQICDYLFNNQIHDVDNDIEGFAKELIDLAINEPNQIDVNNLINISLKLNSTSDIFTDEFALSLDPYIDLDLAALSIDPQTIAPNMIVLNTYLRYRLLRQLNSGWSNSHCFWEATKEIIHISLDTFGLIPVGGEIADLANGVLYTIEGEGLNATLSYASAIPIIGWATTGTKYGIKIAATVSGSTKLVWRVTNNVIQFGDRAQLRKVLHLVNGNPLVAHHIIPWAKSGNLLIQRAAKSINAFHMNEAINGIPLSTLVHNGSHAHYDGIIVQKMNDFMALFPNATPNQCYNKLMSIIHEVRTAILNNPTIPINQLNF